MRVALLGLTLLLGCGPPPVDHALDPVGPSTAYLVSDRSGPVWFRLYPAGQPSDAPYRPSGLVTPTRIAVPPGHLADIEVRGRIGFFTVFRAAQGRVQPDAHISLRTVVEYDWTRILGVGLAAVAGLSLITWWGLTRRVRATEIQALHLEVERDEAEERARRAESRMGDPVRLGNYRILKRLGQGGHATVYLAEDEFGDRFALKIPKDPTGRFQRECEILRDLRHPGIVRLLSFSVGVPDEPAYMVLEPVQGESLLDRLERPMAPEEGVRIARELLAALAYAHGAGVVHRDVSAGNVILTEMGARLLDFGLARQDLKTTMTAPDQTMGTPAYAAPEQIDSHTVDARADLFAVGVLLYQMLTGRLPWQEKDAVKLFLAKSGNVPPAPNELNPMLPRKLSELVMELLRPDPAERPPDAATVLRRLG